jgi:type VI secretion system protein ImpK
MTNDDMQDDLGNLVHPVFAYGLNLRDRLDRGAAPALASEQAALKTLLQSDHDAARWAEFGGEEERQGLAFRPEPDGEGRPASGERFLGARYALACWLDELFILYSPWEAAWNERKLEVALYGSNDRAWKFWDQARLAETRPTTDALEVFFLCVMLGFRGELRDDPDRLRAWVGAAQARLSRPDPEWPHPPELEPPTNVPPLHGRDRFRQMAYVGGMVLLLLVPILTFLAVQHWGD